MKNIWQTSNITHKSNNSTQKNSGFPDKAEWIEHGIHGYLRLDRLQIRTSPFLKRTNQTSVHSRNDFGLVLNLRGFSVMNVLWFPSTVATSRSSDLANAVFRECLLTADRGVWYVLFEVVINTEPYRLSLSIVFSRRSSTWIFFVTKFKICTKSKCFVKIKPYL